MPPEDVDETRKFLDMLRPRRDSHESAFLMMWKEACAEEDARDAEIAEYTAPLEARIVEIEAALQVLIDTIEDTGCCSCPFDGPFPSDRTQEWGCELPEDDLRPCKMGWREWALAKAAKDILEEAQRPMTEGEVATIEVVNSPELLAATLEGVAAAKAGSFCTWEETFGDDSSIEGDGNMNGTLIEQRIYDNTLDFVHNMGHLVRRILVQDMVITVHHGLVYSFIGDPGPDYTIVGRVEVQDEIVALARVNAEANGALQGALGELEKIMKPTIPD